MAAGCPLGIGGTRRAEVTTSQALRSFSPLQLLAAVDVTADFSKMQFLAVGSYTAALWKSSECASELHAEAS